MTGMRELKYFEHWGSNDKKLAFYFIYSVDGEIFDKGVRDDRSSFFEYLGVLTIRHPDRDLRVVMDEGIVDILEKEKAEARKKMREQQRGYSD